MRRRCLSRASKPAATKSGTSCCVQNLSSEVRLRLPSQERSALEARVHPIDPEAVDDGWAAMKWRILGSVVALNSRIASWTIRSALVTR